MNGYPSHELVEALRKEYPAGTRVRLIRMDDPYSTLRPGDQGTVVTVDSIGTYE